MFAGAAQMPGSRRLVLVQFVARLNYFSALSKSENRLERSSDGA